MPAKGTKKVKGETAILRIQREVKIEYVEPIRNCVNKFIEDDAKEDNLNDKIKALQNNLKAIKNAD